jgi:anti-sigma factor RsiW
VDCARVDEELIGFQLAALEGATRAAVEAHLTGCSRCVSSYLALKRAMDAAEDATAPSMMTRARIRAEAAKELSAVSSQPSAPERKSRRATWAIATAAAAAILASPFVYKATHAPSATVGTPQAPVLETTPVKGNETIDTARATPENLAFL